MGEIGKQRQLNEKKKYGGVQEYSFYEIRWILKFLFKHYFMNEINIFLIWLKKYLNDCSHIIYFKAVFTF